MSQKCVKWCLVCGIGYLLYPAHYVLIPKNDVMKKNMAIWDRMIRTLVALLILVLYFTNVISGTVAFALIGLGILYLVTSAIGFCPMYPVLGISKRKN